MQIQQLIRQFYVTLMCLFMCSCAPKLILEETSFSSLNNWQGNHLDALRAFDKSCEKLLTLPHDYDLNIGGKVSDWLNICFESSVYLNKVESDKGLAGAFFEKHFTPYKAYNRSNSEGLFTGYYEPALYGSLTKSPRYQYPLYKRPDDLTNEPYLGRRRIELGELDGKGLELVYVDDPISLFFLQIQGSGRIIMDDNSIMKVGYDGKNNCPYSSIGKYLIEEGELVREEVTADSIKIWLRDNPTRNEEVLLQNQSYIFFKTLPANSTGPLGAQEVELSPEASIAIDPAFIPYGAPIWLETTMPDVGHGEEGYHKLLIAQDTGGVIKGPVRGDIFFGFGNRAEKFAGHMKQKGEYYILLPKNVVVNNGG